MTVTLVEISLNHKEIGGNGFKPQEQSGGFNKMDKSVQMLIPPALDTK